MQEGKLPLHSLERLLESSGRACKAVLQGPRIGSDVAVIDCQLAARRSQDFYQSSSESLLVFKTDPITFPAPNPGKSLVIVNANDIVTSGALPFGFNTTMVFPPSFSEEEVFEIQKNIHATCSALNVTILGGHTEFSSSVNYPILSGAMLGFVPREFFVPRTVVVGDVIVCVGFCAKEGIGIIAHEGKDLFSQNFNQSFISKLIALGEDISIVDVALKINKRVHPGLMHDATEGGILGAIYETIVPEGFGLQLYSEKFPLTNETQELCSYLDIDPLRLISSGALIVVTSQEKAARLLQEATKDVPIAIVGEVLKKAKGARIDSRPLVPPEADILIDALKKIEKEKKTTGSSL